MIKYVKRDFRLKVAVESLIEKQAFFWTFTTADICSYREVSKRWKNVRHWLGEHYRPFRYVQNFEVHPFGHGWHVHFISDTFINLKLHLSKIQSFGFGRVNVKKVTSNGISDYLLKHSWKPVKRHDKDSTTIRVRLVNISKNLQCPLKRFEVVGGSTGWLSPASSLDDYRLQIIGKTYGMPIVPRLKFELNEWSTIHAMQLDLFR